MRVCSNWIRVYHLVVVYDNYGTGRSTTIVGKVHKTHGHNEELFHNFFLLILPLKALMMQKD